MQSCVWGGREAGEAGGGVERVHAAARGRARVPCGVRPYGSQMTAPPRCVTVVSGKEPNQ